MASNKENRPSKPKTEGEKHQGVGVNPEKYKGHALGTPAKQNSNSSSNKQDSD